MSGNGDDLRPETVTGDPAVHTTLDAPFPRNRNPDGSLYPLRADEELNREAEARDRRTEEALRMARESGFKERERKEYMKIFDDIDKRLDKLEKCLQGPQSPEQITQAVENINHLRPNDRQFAKELLQSWCAAPRTG